MPHQRTTARSSRGVRGIVARSTILAAAIPCLTLLAVGPAMALGSDWDIRDQKVLGPLAISPTSGDLETPITLTTGGGCPQGTNTITRVFGPGFPAGGENVVGNSKTILYGSPPADRLVVPMTITIHEAARRQPRPVTLAGDYRLVLDCQVPLPKSELLAFGFYVGHLHIDNERYTATTTDKDLPDPPAPRTGPDAAALTAAPTPPPEPEAAQPTPTAQPVAAEPTSGASGNGLPLAVGGGILLVGLGSIFLYSRVPARNPLGAKR
jgi:hypothetical protein